MSKYAENNLRKDEVIICKVKKNPLAAFPQILFFLICLAGGIVAAVKIPSPESAPPIGIIVMSVLIAIGALALIIKIIRIITMELAVTNKRVIGKVGIISVNSLDYPIEKVDNVSVKNTLWGAIFRFTTVIVLGGGGGDARIQFPGISNATQFKNTVTDAIEQHAKEARKHQAEEIAAAMSRDNPPKY